MSKAPKYSYRVVEKRNNTWTAEIQRQATSKKKVVSKRQTSFASEDEGIAWAKVELEKILVNHIERNKRHDEERAEQYQEKLKKAELAAAQASLEVSEEATATEEEENTSFALTEEQQLKAIADLQELEQLENDDDDKESAAKPKFDFEVELEEAELAEKEALKKAKAKKSKKADVADADDDALTADGSDSNRIKKGK